MVNFGPLLGNPVLNSYFASYHFVAEGRRWFATSHPVPQLPFAQMSMLFFFGLVFKGIEFTTGYVAPFFRWGIDGNIPARHFLLCSPAVSFNGETLQDEASFGFPSSQPPFWGHPPTCFFEGTLFRVVFDGKPKEHNFSGSPNRHPF